MSIVSEIKCARCDRMYSGVRSRCPYCGARRIGRGKYSEESDNSKGKMLVGILVLAILVIAVVVLLFATPNPDDGQGTDVRSTDTSPPDPTGGMGDGSTVSESGPSISPSTPPSTDPPITTPPAPLVESVTITYNGSRRKDFSIKIAEQVPLKLKIEPVGVDAEITWTSSDRDIFDVVPSDTDGKSAVVTGIGIGEGLLTVKVGDFVETCIVRGTKR